MKGTANCTIWYLLLDCKEDSYKSWKGCPGCFSSINEDKLRIRFGIGKKDESPCETCLFYNIIEMRQYCSGVGARILKEMEDV